MGYLITYSHNSALKGETGLGTTWANEMNLGMKHAIGAGSLARPVDLQSSVLPLLPIPAMFSQEANHRLFNQIMTQKQIYFTVRVPIHISSLIYLFIFAWFFYPNSFPFTVLRYGLSM